MLGTIIVMKVLSYMIFGTIICDIGTIKCDKIKVLAYVMNVPGTIIVTNVLLYVKWINVLNNMMEVLSYVILVPSNVMMVPLMWCFGNLL